MGVKLPGSRKLEPGGDLGPTPQWSTGTSTEWNHWGRCQTTCPTCQHRSVRAPQPRTTGSGTWNPTAHLLASSPNPSTCPLSDKDHPSVGTLCVSSGVCPHLGTRALVGQVNGVTSQDLSNQSRGQAGTPAALPIPGPGRQLRPVLTVSGSLFTVSSTLETSAGPEVRWSWG